MVENIQWKRVNNIFEELDNYITLPSGHSNAYKLVITNRYNLQTRSIIGFLLDVDRVMSMQSLHENMEIGYELKLQNINDPEHPVSIIIIGRSDNNKIYIGHDSYSIKTRIMSIEINDIHVLNDPTEYNTDNYEIQLFFIPSHNYAYNSTVGPIENKLPLDVLNEIGKYSDVSDMITEHIRKKTKTRRGGRGVHTKQYYCKKRNTYKNGKKHN